MYGDAQSRGLTQCTFQGRRPPSRLMSYRFTPCMQGRISLSSSPESSRHAIVLSPSLNLHSPTGARRHVLVTLLHTVLRRAHQHSRVQTTEYAARHTCYDPSCFQSSPVRSRPIASACFTLSSRRSLHALSLRAARSARAYIARAFLPDFLAVVFLPFWML